MAGKEEIEHVSPKEVLLNMIIQIVKYQSALSAFTGITDYDFKGEKANLEKVRIELQDMLTNYDNELEEALMFDTSDEAVKKVVKTYAEHLNINL